MYHFIMNPMASSGKGIKVWKQVETVLKKENIEYEMHMLSSAKETTEFVRKLTVGIEENYLQECAATLESSGQESISDQHIVVLGGDGTLNTVLNGIVDFEHTILSCIRTGSGNDFARNVGILRNPGKAIKHLLHNPEKQCLDYGEAVYHTEQKQIKRRFIISSGVGYDADICEEVGRSALKKAFNRVKLGKLVYVTIGIKQIFTRKSSGATLWMDEETPRQIPGLFFVVGMIHEREGGGVPFCPEADATDGLLDVCLVSDMPKWKLLLAVAMVYMKKHLLFRNITKHRCKRMCVELEKPQWFHVDGETSEKIRRLELECKQGLRFYQ